MRHKSFFDMAVDALGSVWLTLTVALFIAAPFIALHFVFKWW